MSKFNYDGPVVLVIMDGVGLSDKKENNASGNGFNFNNNGINLP